ncbi:Thymus-specific serine protease, partial [Blyttiomyces sp. JEL0837]
MTQSKTCATGFTRAIGILDHKIDTVIAYQHARPNDAQKLKDSFWFGQVHNWGDFTGYVSTVFSFSVQYGDQNSFFDNNGTTWIQALCDGVMFPAFTNPNATDDELFTALQNMTIQSLIGLYGITGNDDPQMETFNSDGLGNDTSVNAHYKLWPTQYCNEFGYLVTAVPHGERLESHSMVSKYVNVDNQVWACRAYLDDKNVYPNVDRTNDYYGGLDIRTGNILWVNGDIYPWHWLSNYRSAPG